MRRIMEVRGKITLFMYFPIEFFKVYFWAHFCGKVFLEISILISDKKSQIFTANTLGELKKF